MYHLTALNYGHDKFHKKISELTDKKRLGKSDPAELKETIREIKKLCTWYQKYIQEHQCAAMDHIPETQRKKWEQESRKKKTNRTSTHLPMIQ